MRPRGRGGSADMDDKEVLEAHERAARDILRWAVRYRLGDEDIPSIYAHHGLNPRLLAAGRNPEAAGRYGEIRGSHGTTFRFRRNAELERQVEALQFVVKELEGKLQDARAEG